MDRRDPAAEGELELRRPQPLWLPIVFGIAVLSSIGGLPIVLSAMYGAVPPAWFAVGAAPAAALWVIFVVGADRLARAGRVSWDGWGLYEWADREVRTAIAWDAARVELDVAPRSASLIGARVFDDAGRCISLLTPDTSMPEWPLSRPCVADRLDAIAPRLRALPTGIAAPDRRDRARPTALWMQPRVVFPFVALTSIACAWVPPLMLLFGGVVALALIVTSLPAAIELARLLHASWQMRGARALSLERVDGGTLIARALGSSELHLDARGWTASDASLAVRPRGHVFARLGAAAPELGPYRGVPAATHALEVVETAYDRRARRDRIVAVSFELAWRVALIAGAVRLAWALLLFLASLT